MMTGRGNENLHLVVGVEPVDANDSVMLKVLKPEVAILAAVPPGKDVTDVEQKASKGVRYSYTTQNFAWSRQKSSE